MDMIVEDENEVVKYSTFLTWDSSVQPLNCTSIIPIVIRSYFAASQFPSYDPVGGENKEQLKCK